MLFSLVVAIINVVVDGGRIDPTCVNKDQFDGLVYIKATFPEINIYIFRFLLDYTNLIAFLYISVNNNVPV